MQGFSSKSLEKLMECHPDLIRLFQEVGKNYECSIICGHRTKEEQEKAYEAGLSKKSFPNSKHNVLPSLAIDSAPFPLDWQDNNRFYYFAGYVKATADRLGIKIRWGGDWNSNNNFKEEKFQDLVHFELID